MRGEVKCDGPSVSSAVSFYSFVCPSNQNLHDVLEQRCASLGTELEATVVISEMANIIKMKASKHHELNRLIIRFVRNTLHVFIAVTAFNMFRQHILGRP